MADHRTQPADPRPPRLGEHAIVIGGSMAGLLAARVLSESYDRVTVLDRDVLADQLTDGRRAVRRAATPTRCSSAASSHSRGCLRASRASRWRRAPRR